MYREDESAAQDFSSICSREAPSDPIERDSVCQATGLRDEYLVAVLENGHHYSVSQDTSRIAPDGTTVKEEKTVHFQVLDTAHGRHRPKQMAVTTPHENLAQSAHLAIQVIPEDRWVPEPPPAPAPGGGEQHFLTREFKAVWLRPEEIGPADSWYNRLKIW